MKETIKSGAGIVGLLLLPAVIMFVISIPFAAIVGEFNLHGIWLVFIFMMMVFGIPCEIGLFLAIVMGMDDKGFGYGCVFWYVGAAASRWLVPYLPENLTEIGYFFAFAVVGLALWVFHLKTKGDK